MTDAIDGHAIVAQVLDWFVAHYPTTILNSLNPLLIFGDQRPSVPADHCNVSVVASRLPSTPAKPSHHHHIYNVHTKDLAKRSKQECEATHEFVL